MSNSNSSKRRKPRLKHRVQTLSQSVGLSPLRILISLILLLGIGFLIFTVAFAPKDNNVVATPGEIKLQQEELELDSRLQEILSQNPAPGENFLAVIERMNEFENELDTFESKNDLTDSQKETIDRIRLRNKSVIMMTMSRNKVSSDAEKADLIEFCKSKVDSEDELMREGALFWLCIVPAIEFIAAPSAETLKNFTDASDKHAEGYINNPQHASTLAKILFSLSQKPQETDEYWKKSFDVLSLQLNRSQFESIRELSVKLDSLKLFGKFNLPTLANRILWGDPGATEDLGGLLEVLGQNLDTDLRTWVAIIKAYESFLATDKIEETGAAWQMMSAMANKVTEPEKKKTLLEILDRQQKRALVVGSPFDASGTTVPRGEVLHVEDNEYTAVFFCDKGTASLKCLTQLGTETKGVELGYRAVLAFSSILSEADLKSIERIPAEISIVDDETAKRYFQAMPVDFFPYIMLIDRTGKVLFANLDIDQIASRVAKEEAKKRQAQ